MVYRSPSNWLRDQVAALGVRGTVARLVSRLELLKLGHRTAVPRHQTLQGNAGLELRSAVGRGEDCFQTNCPVCRTVQP